MILTSLDPVWQFAPCVYISFLGCVDKIGIAFEAPTVSTGFGAYLAQVKVDCFYYVLDCIVYYEMVWVQIHTFFGTSRLLARWVSSHPVDGHLQKKIVLFFMLPSKRFIWVGPKAHFQWHFSNPA